VRTPLLDLQRQAGADGGVVLEGRDIGTVVFPDAEAKIFLTADASVRARRRFEELTQRGQTNDDGTPLDLVQLEREIRQRDAQDASREIAPLKQADGALYIDSSVLSIDATVATLRDYVHSRTKG
jgi:cytidylate kinase